MYTFLNVAARIHQGMSQYMLECELEQKGLKGYQNFKMRKNVEIYYGILEVAS